jgi:hypothetical protein
MAPTVDSPISLFRTAPNIGGRVPLIPKGVHPKYSTINATTEKLTNGPHAQFASESTAFLDDTAVNP